MRWLKGLVIIMGVLIVVGLGLVGVTLVQRMAGDEVGADGTGADGMPTAFGPVAVGMPVGGQLVDMALGDGRLALRLSLPDGGARVLLFDAATGQALGAIELRPGADGAPPAR